MQGNKILTAKWLEEAIPEVARRRKLYKQFVNDQGVVDVERSCGGWTILVCYLELKQKCDLKVV